MNPASAVNVNVANVSLLGTNGVADNWTSRSLGLLELGESASAMSALQHGCAWRTNAGVVHAALQTSACSSVKR